jgi:hypothetical protein
MGLTRAPGKHGISGRSVDGQISVDAAHHDYLVGSATENVGDA